MDQKRRFRFSHGHLFESGYLSPNIRIQFGLHKGEFIELVAQTFMIEMDGDGQDGLPANGRL